MLLGSPAHTLKKGIPDVNVVATSWERRVVWGALRCHHKSFRGMQNFANGDMKQGETHTCTHIHTHAHTYLTGKKTDKEP